MRLFEIATPNFYLCTDYEQTKGDTIEGHQKAFRLSSILEHKLEVVRPENRLPRQTSLFVFTEPLSVPFVYLVEPLTETDCLHTGWLRMLEGANLNSIGEVEHATRGYWSGKIMPEAQGEPWEHRVAKVRIVRRVGGWDSSSGSSPNPLRCSV